MKKTLSAALLLVLIFSLAACSRKKTESTASSDPEEKSYKIAFVAAGIFGDYGMNDAMLKGMKDFTAQTGIDVVSVEVTEFGDNMINARNFAEQKYDLIVMGAPVSDVIPEVASAYPDTIFVLNKGTITDTSNILSITFDEPSGAFLAGSYAALMTKELGSISKIGWVGGMRIPDLEVSKYAFMAGAKLNGAETKAVYVGDFKDSAKAKEITLQMFSENIPIVQSFAGGAATGVYQATESRPEGVYAMGSATGQFHMSERIIASQIVNYDLFYTNLLIDFVNNNGFRGKMYIVGNESNWFK